MARKNIHCVTAKEQAGFEKLIELNQGDEAKAFKIWEDNGYKVPDEAMSLVGDDLRNNSFIMPDEVITDPILLTKQKAVRKAKALMTAKLKSLNIAVLKNPGIEKGRDELEAILDNIDNISAEETLIAFIQTADNMTKKAESWLELYSSGKKTPTLDNLKKIEEYVASFSLLEELNESMFENEEHKEIFNTVQAIMGRHRNIRNGYITLARKEIAKGLQGNFHKITRLYEKKAEQIFDKHKKPHLEKSEIPQAKAEFISKYMIDKATEIDLRTTAYIENMLLQTVDIPVLTSFIVNPKDMNNDVIGIALESLDNADMQIWTQMQTVVDDSEILNNEFIKAVGKQSDPKKQYAILLDNNEIINKNSPKYEEFKKTYENVPGVWNLYNHLAKLIEEKDKMVYKGSRLGYRLPKIEQSNLERLYNKGILASIKEGIGDKIKLRGKDIELGLLSEDDLANNKIKEASNVEEVYITEAGEERATIPLHYRRLKIDEKDQSYDIVKLIALDYHNCLKFKVKTETAVFLDVLKDVMHEADIIQTTSFVRKLKLNKETKDIHTTKGKSQITETLEALIRHRIYGIKIEGDAKTAKIFQSLSHYTSFLTMSANMLSSVPNFAHGATMSWIEALGGNTGYFTPRDRAYAVKQYNMAVPSLINDIGERVPNSKVNLLARKFNAMSESHILNGKGYAQNNKIKRIAESSALLAMNNMGEHAMQSIVMLATLNNIKVKDVNGDFLDKDFKPTKNRKEAIGVADAMLQDSTKLEFHPSVNSTERTKGVGQNDINQISRRIRRITRDLYGNYDAENKARYQRTGAGAMVSQMRGWLITGFQKRWRGLGTSGVLGKDFIDFEDQFKFENAHRLSYNNEINEFEEGHYVTTLKFLRVALGEMKALKSIAGSKEAWQQMDDQQKSNVKKTLIETALIITMLLLSNMFDDDKEDPDDIANLYAAYLTRRMYSELFTFANPSETVRTFRSPAIAISTVESTINAVSQLFSDPFEQYESGRHLGEYKLWRDIKKLIPVVKQFDRDIEDSYQFLIR